MDTDRQWLTQRHILERLQEEVARAERHHEPFTIALAEIEAPAPEGKEAAPTLTEWVIDRVSRTKRRCDAAGQYGLRGFLLLLVHTARDGGLICCHRLQKQLEEAENTVEAGSAGPVRACFGIASFSGQSTTPQALLSRAEQQLEIARASDTERVQAD
jgi:diguanylate cyclase (GGDEF)-like protein